jgi:hypothetical protein
MIYKRVLQSSTLEEFHEANHSGGYTESMISFCFGENPNEDNNCSKSYGIVTSEQHTHWNNTSTALH